jgi:hypothetical protein
MSQLNRALDFKQALQTMITATPALKSLMTGPSCYRPQTF